jgi:two-component system, cell cycle response regulator
MTLRVLVVESQLEDLVFLQDVLTELDGGNYWSNWTRVSALYATSWAEAASFLTTEPIDVMLLNPDLDDCQGAETFRRSQALAPQIPVVLITDSGGIPLAQRVLREGAQDFVIRTDVDCVPLARALCNAVGRHRLLAATRSTSMLDPLTGLLNRAAFLLFAERDRMMAERLDRRMILILAEVKDADRDRHDLALVASADHIRSLAGPVDLTGRIGDTMLAISVLETDHQSAEEVWARLHGSASDRRVVLGAAVFNPETAASLDQLLEQAAQDLAPKAMASAR